MIATRTRPIPRAVRHSCRPAHSGLHPPPIGVDDVGQPVPRGPVELSMGSWRRNGAYGLSVYQEPKKKRQRPSTFNGVRFQLALVFLSYVFATVAGAPVMALSRHQQGFDIPYGRQQNQDIRRRRRLNFRLSSVRSWAMPGRCPQHGAPTRGGWGHPPCRLFEIPDKSGR